MNRLDDVAEAGERPRLPLLGLLCLSTAAFLTAMLETVPAGILPMISAGLHTSEAAVGQTITVYALGSLLGAIPVVTATMSWPRRRLLAMSLIAFAVTTAIAAVSPWLLLTLVARFITGIFAGVIWSVTALIAMRITPEPLQGRGITIAMAGPSVALAIGTPIGVGIANALGWRATFAVLAALSVVVLVWARLTLPALPTQPHQENKGVLAALRRPGVLTVIASSVLFITAHYVTYTYAATLLDHAGHGASVGALLLVFGVAAVISLWGVGALIDRHLRSVVLIGLVLLDVAMLALALFTHNTLVLFLAFAAWGLGFSTNNGPAPQKAVTDAAGDTADAAQAAIVTGWNIGIALGGLLGGVLLGSLGVAALPWVSVALMTAALLVILGARRDAYPA